VAPTGRSPSRDNDRVQYVVIAVSFGIATGVIGRAKGSSFFIWLLVGTVLPLLGLIGVILYRPETDEPERRCPRCGKVVKLYVQFCPRCGEDLFLPDPSEVRRPAR
jgi:ribosomal protein S27AE